MRPRAVISGHRLKSKVTSWLNSNVILKSLNQGIGISSMNAVLYQNLRMKFSDRHSSKNIKTDKNIKTNRPKIICT